VNAARPFGGLHRELTAPRDLRINQIGVNCICANHLPG
jgi:hypothetical protein